MTTQNATTYGQPAIGCYLDQSYRNATEHDSATVRLAESFGFPVDADGEKLLRRAELDCLSDDRDDAQCLSEYADEAIDWLNSQEGRTGLYWANDGEAGAFGLWVSLESVKEDVGFVSVRSLAEARRMGIETSEEDSAYPPDDYRGEWLHVSDHGNATLYVREDCPMREDGAGMTNFIDREVWSVV